MKTVHQAALANINMYLPAMPEKYVGPPGSTKYAPSRSRYIPAGPQRNCGYAGISPKHVKVAVVPKPLSLRRI